MSIFCTLLENALSFSIDVWYSFGVVAPIIFMVPSDKYFLIIFPAEFDSEPFVFKSMKVCISSRNIMTFVLDAQSNSIAILSSKSPLNLVPAVSKELFT